MILVDSSVWIDHLHRGEAELADALARSLVVQHPMVIGELALGSLRDREEFLGLLGRLPGCVNATHREVAALIDERRLCGRGLGLVDAHLLAATLLSPGVSLWTRDTRLRRVAAELGLAHPNARRPPR